MKKSSEASISNRSYFVEVTRCGKDSKQVIMEMREYLLLSADELANTVVRFYWRNDEGIRIYVTELEELAQWFGSKLPRVLH